MAGALKIFLFRMNVLSSSFYVLNLKIVVNLKEIAVILKIKFYAFFLISKSPFQRKTI